MKKTYHLSLITYHLSRGFTLIELLISMGLMSVILTILTSLFVSVIEAQLESQATSSVDQDGRFILTRLSYDIHRANSIVIPATLGGQGETLQFISSGITYTYTLNGSILNLTDNTGTEIVNSPRTTVTNVSFRRLGNTLSGKNTIEIQFTVTSTVTRPQETRTYKTTVGIR
ncbi:MAG: prepilin-type N-terminal cleavage/methylation domain-containing protein [Candidatus Levybacteria bacterium]|nr:prepilin-type N-terminal cleavage/methylation domain-containing protein [Candidatus Levybacteria bacterium]